MSEDEKNEQNQLLLIKISIKLGSDKDFAKLGQGGGFSPYQEHMIWKYRNISGHMETWYDSKIFVNFVDFSFIYTYIYIELIVI